MNILRLRAYYDPEQTAGIHLDHDLSEAFMNNEIHYISYTPSPTRGVTQEVRKQYKARKTEILYDGFAVVHRFSMIPEGTNPIQRALRYAACSVKEYSLGIKEKDIDVVYSSSTPPTQGMLSALVAKKLSKLYGRRVPFVYNLQDVFPDSLVNAGMTRKGSLIWKIGRKIEDFTYGYADKIIVISEGFKRNIMAKGVPADKIVVISNWVDLNEVAPIERENNKLFDQFSVDRSKFIVLYAGNLGEAQGAEIILDVAKTFLEINEIQFVIFGGGAKYQEAVDRVEKESISNVIITGLQPQDRVSEVYSMGDIALITCKPGTGKSGMPSKTWSIMACNTPIVASFDLESDLTNVINKSGAGICVVPGDVGALHNAIMEMYKNKETNRDIRGFVKEHASKEVCVAKYIDTILQCSKRNGK